MASILLAFGIDAAWDARAEASRRSAVIEGLRSDFEAARLDLDRVTGFHQTSRSAAEELMQLGAAGPLPASDAPLVDSLFAEIFFGGSFDPPLGTLQSLVSSGALDLVDDTDLTVLLTGFPALVADLDREQAFLREVMLELYRYLVELGIGAEASLSKGYWEAPWSVQSNQVYAAVHLPGFRSWVGLLWTVYGNTTVDHRELDVSLTAIESRLAALR